jgi:hypothetical protein
MARLLPDGTETRRVWLVGCPGYSQREWTHASGEKLTHSNGNESVSGADWKRRAFISTGNASIEIYMRSTRLFESAFYAWLWRMNLVESGTHGPAVPLSGAVVVRGYADDDTLFYEYILRDAVVVLDPMQGSGQTLETGFTFKGPRVLPYRSGYTSLLTAPVRAWVPPEIHLVMPAVGSSASTNALTFPPAGELFVISSESVGTAPTEVAVGYTMWLDYVVGEGIYFPLLQWSVNGVVQRGTYPATYDVFAALAISQAGPVEPGYTLRESLMSLAGSFDESTYNDQEEYVFNGYEGLSFGARRVLIGTQHFLRYRLISCTPALQGGRFLVRCDNDGYFTAPAFKRLYETRSHFLQPARLLFGGAAFSVDVVDDGTGN